MTRTIGIAVVVAGAVTASGCLQMDTAHRLYLTPAGSLAWTIQQTDVRSDIEQAPGRLEEEGRFLSEVETGTHPVARALQTLGAERLRTDVLRRERPFALVTTGDFARVDAVANRMLEQLGLQGRAALTRNGGKTTLTLSVRLPEDEDTYDGDLTALLEDLQQYRVVLTAGRFVASEGFTLSPDHAVATPVAPDDPAGEIRFALTWIE